MSMHSSGITPPSEDWTQYTHHCPRCGADSQRSAHLGDGFALCTECGQEWNVVDRASWGARRGVDPTDDHRAALRQTARQEQAPRDGETLGVFVYNAQYRHWRYNAGYGDAETCMRRGTHLSNTFGVDVLIREFDGEWFAYVTSDQTPILRAALASAPRWRPRRSGRTTPPRMWRRRSMSCGATGPRRGGERRWRV